MKKLITIILLLITSISYGQTTLAGAGTSGDPYQIWDGQDMDSVRYYAASNLYFKLMDDIDLDSNILGHSWVPIFDSTTTKWNNRLYGNYKTISNMQIVKSHIGYVANTSKQAFIAQISLNNTVTEYGRGQIENVKFNNCSVYIDGDMASNSAWIAIVVGEVTGGAGSGEDRKWLLQNVLVTNSSIITDNDLLASTFYCGGVVGAATFMNNVGFEGSIIISGNTTSSTSSWTRIGGVLGATSTGKIENSYAKASIHIDGRTTMGRMQLGGLVGSYVSTSSQYLDNYFGDCFFRGTISTNSTESGYSDIGGMFGAMTNNLYSATYDTLRNVYAVLDTFNVPVVTSRVGWWLGDLASHAYGTFEMDTTGYAASGHPMIGDPDAWTYDSLRLYTNAEMKLRASYPNYVFDDEPDSIWYMSDYPELLWTLDFGNLIVSNPIGDYTELYRVGDSVLVAWTSTTDDSSYIYIEGVLVDSSSSPYYWVSDLADTLGVRVTNIADGVLTDTTSFYVYDTLYSSLTILGVLGDSLTFESSGIDSVAYYYSLDSNLWVWIDKVMVTEIGFTDTTTFYLSQYDWGAPQAVVYVKVKEIALVELFLTGTSPSLDTSYYGVSNITCNEWGLTNAGTATNLVDASCGWSGGGTREWITYNPPSWDYGTNSWDFNTTTIVDPVYGDDCCPPGTVYDMSCWEPFCGGVRWDNLYVPDSIFFGGRYYFIPNGASDSVHVFDPLNDTTYAYFQIDSLTNSSYQAYQYFHAYTDAQSGNSYLMFSTAGTPSGGSILGFTSAVATLPADQDKALAQDITTISQSYFIRDYFRGYYPKMLR